MASEAQQPALVMHVLCLSGMGYRTCTLIHDLYKIKPGDADSDSECSNAPDMDGSTISTTAGQDCEERVYLQVEMKGVCAATVPYTYGLGEYSERPVLRRDALVDQGVPRSTLN